VSHSILRRRRLRTVATAVAVTLGSLAVPAAALADGQLDPAFNGTGYHLGTVAEGTVFNNVDTRIPMIVQANGSVVIGGSRGGFMTLARYTPAGALDTSFGVGGFATAQFAGTAGSAPGNSGATAMTQVGTDIIVGGFGASQSMVAARFSVNGTFTGAAVCFAPHLIDYTARAVAARPNGTVVLAGYARDRWPTQAVPPLPAALYGQRAVVTVPTNGTIDTTTCGSTAVAGQGSAGVTIDGLNHDGTGADPTVSGRYYDGVAALPDNSYVVASTNGADANVTAGNAAWVLRFTAAGALDTTFNATGAGSIVPVAGRLPIPNANLHAIRLNGTDVYVAGESLDATAANRRMLVARILATGAMGTFGSGGIALARVAGGNDSGQAFVFQGTNIIVGGSANLAGKAALGLVRLNAAGVVDGTFGTGGQTSTPLGTPAVNGYITGMAVTGNFVVVSGRATDPSGLATVAARYFHTGAPVPPPPLPAAATNAVDQITTSSARVNGTVNANGSAGTWWVQYGTTTAYGSQSAPQPIAASNDDIGVAAAIAGLAPGAVYHARIFISTTAGIDPGEDVAFTTLGTPPAGGAAAGGAAAGSTGTVTGGTKGTTVVTQKSKAKKQCVVPKVTGKKLNKARTTVYAKGCKVQVKYVKSKKATNTVLTQSRKAGKKLGYRAVVKLTVAAKAAALKKS
jgi:uncharacterized delta-60 repeat protein